MSIPGSTASRACDTFGKQKRTARGDVAKLGPIGWRRYNQEKRRHERRFAAMKGGNRVMRGKRGKRVRGYVVLRRSDWHSWALMTGRPLD